MYFSYFTTCAAVSCGYFARDLEAECYFTTASLIRKVENVLVTKYSTIWAELLFLKNTGGNYSRDWWPWLKYLITCRYSFRKMYDSSMEGSSLGLWFINIQGRTQRLRENTRQILPKAGVGAGKKIVKPSHFGLRVKRDDVDRPIWTDTFMKCSLLIKEITCDISYSHERITE